MIPESRTYRHIRCKSATQVFGPEYTALSDPLLGMVRTYCAECDELFPLDQFVWEDSRERISDFYARHAAKVSPLGRLFGSRNGLFTVAGLGALLGLLSGLLIGSIAGWLMGAIVILIGLIVGTIVGVMVSEYVIRPAIAKHWLGVTDMRMLR